MTDTTDAQSAAPAALKDGRVIMAYWEDAQDAGGKPDDVRTSNISGEHFESDLGAFTIAFLAGIEATSRELEQVFARHGISRVESKGQPLDPHKHQAMLEIPHVEAEPGTIIEEMQPGYVMKDRLLRPALVGVAKKP